MSRENKAYIGDGVYVEWKGYAFALTAENGIKVTNEIWLEPDALEALVEYAKRWTGADRG